MRVVTLLCLFLCLLCLSAPSVESKKIKKADKASKKQPQTLAAQEGGGKEKQTAKKKKTVQAKPAKGDLNKKQRRAKRRRNKKKQREEKNKNKANGAAPSPFPSPAPSFALSPAPVVQTDDETPPITTLKSPQPKEGPPVQKVQQVPMVQQVQQTPRIIVDPKPHLPLAPAPTAAVVVVPPVVVDNEPEQQQQQKEPAVAAVKGDDDDVAAVDASKKATKGSKVFVGSDDDAHDDGLNIPMVAFMVVGGVAAVAIFGVGLRRRMQANLTADDDDVKLDHSSSDSVIYQATTIARERIGEGSAVLSPDSAYRESSTFILKNANTGQDGHSSVFDGRGSLASSSTFTHSVMSFDDRDSSSTFAHSVMSYDDGASDCSSFVSESDYGGSECEEGYSVNL